MSRRPKGPKAKPQPPVHRKLPHWCTWLVRQHILISNSPRAKPWHNGRQESFYNTFKLEFGKPMRHATIEGLTEAIGRYIHYYNTRRIHGTLRLIPRQFAEKKRYPKTLPESGGLPV